MESLVAPHARAQARGAGSAVTYAGLAIALFGIPATTATFRLLTGETHSNLQLATRELTLFALVGILLLLVTRAERQPLSSIGLRFDRPGRSILRGLILGVVMLVLSVALYLVLPKIGLHVGGSGSHPFVPAIAVVTLHMLRAAVAEEIFFRGYAIERLEKLTGSPWIASLASLLVFASSHYVQGLGGIVGALVLGGVMTVYYVKRRDLLANVTGHFLVDMVLNVALPLLGG
ncbi:MAG: CPBP family intramembrane glutamic endopeptidase [Polyangiaceae bacterium]|jgi:uncharacterized protein